MVDTVSTTVIHDVNDRYVVHLTNECDGTGESAVAKVNISALTMKDGTVPTKTGIIDIQYSIGGFNYVVLEWDHSTNDEIAVLSGNGILEFGEWGSKLDPASAGGTGDIQLTTDGNVDGAHYDILLEMWLSA